MNLLRVRLHTIKENPRTQGQYGGPFTAAPHGANMTEETPTFLNDPSAASVESTADTMLCPCYNVTLEQLRAALAADPEIGFDELLSATGAGGKCTACLLDLEYHFVSLPRGPATKSAGSGAKRQPPPERVPLKQRLYRMVDRVTPMRPMTLENVVPVIAGPDIEMWVWVNNWSMLFEGKECAPETAVDFVVRDDRGVIVHRRREVLAPESSTRVNVSRYLPPADGGGAKPVTGSVEIVRRSRNPGVRGTLRPQIEIIAAAGGCAVHSQAASGPVERSFTCLYRPNDDRLFLSLVSRSKRPMDVELEYPLLKAQPDHLPPLRRVESIPPYGARLHEIEMPMPYRDELEGELFSIRWRAPAPYKPYLLCATPNLDRFSIDHV